MKANEASLLKLLDGTKQFIIPTYQRTYSRWPKQCQQLWSDIVKVGNDSRVNTHFIGGIVHIGEAVTTMTWVTKVSVIDGQQRLTTTSLIILALSQVYWELGDEKTQKKLINVHILNPEEDGDNKYKLLPTKLDRELYIKLIEGISVDEYADSNIVANYRYFLEQIRWQKDNIEYIHQWIGKLFIVDISLDRTQDNPQLIFESMNSTGLALSKAELIKNYLLMDIEPQKQTELYNKYWYPMDKVLENNQTLYDAFVRDYLTFKDPIGSIPTFWWLYDEFKLFLKDSNMSAEELLKDMHEIFQLYAKFTLLSTESDEEIYNALVDIDKLKVNVVYPFLIELFQDYNSNKIAKEHLLKILQQIESYVFRRAICGIPTPSLSKTFATVKRFIDKSSSQAYFESFTAYLLGLDSYRVFPRDEVFAIDLKTKDVYNFRSNKYLLEKLENYGKKEKINVSNYSIEHIMPQNKNMSDEWKKELWDNRKDIHTKYLNTLWNLTLTGYNSEYSDRAFMVKKTMEWKWFNYSPVWLNGMLKDMEVWNENHILQRADILTNLAQKVRPIEILSDEILEKYKKVETNTVDEKEYSIEDYSHLAWITLELFEKLREKILFLHPDVKENMRKLYIAYAFDGNFVSIEPQKNKIRLSLNIDIEEIIDPKWICKDISEKWRRGTGNTSVYLNNSNDIDYIMSLVQQAFDKQVG